MFKNTEQVWVSRIQSLGKGAVLIVAGLGGYTLIKGLCANSARGTISQESMSLKVVNEPEALSGWVGSNQAPYVNQEIPNQITTVDQLFSYTFASDTFKDPDQDELSYSAQKTDRSALPSWLAFQSGDRRFYGTPTDEDVGDLPIEVTADDSHGGVVSTTFTISTNEPETDYAGQLATGFGIGIPSITVSILVTYGFLRYRHKQDRLLNQQKHPLAVAIRDHLKLKGIVTYDFDNAKGREFLRIIEGGIVKTVEGYQKTGLSAALERRGIKVSEYHGEELDALAQQIVRVMRYEVLTPKQSRFFKYVQFNVHHIERSLEEIAEATARKVQEEGMTQIHQEASDELASPAMDVELRQM